MTEARPRVLPLHLFPASGLDRSIHAPVFVGLLIATFFSETLGWPFVGLVVPGYLAAVFSAAPITGATIVLEALATYLLARAIGEWIPRTGAWTVFFGRERFFLIVATSVLVRLGAEGVALPWLATQLEFKHAAELYSIGLVLVPLSANASWNVGAGRGLGYSLVLTGLTYVIVEHVLLRYTNLSLSRFGVTYENPALDFLSSAKAYVLLLTSAMLAARNNVEFGWDYNGILVPGLLAVAWYEPITVVSTVVEALVVVAIAKQVVKVPPLSRMVIEGPRRTLLVFTIGFTVNMVLGATADRFFPGRSVAHLYGFGYILPTLIALKVWQKSAQLVLLPTLQMSVVGFFAGNAIGFALATALPPPPDDVATSDAIPTYESSSMAWELTLQTAWPRGAAGPPQEAHLAEIVRAIRDAAAGDRVARAQSLAANFRLRVARVTDEGREDLCLRRPERSPERLPRMAGVCVANEGHGVVVVRGPRDGATGALAARLARALEARVTISVSDQSSAEDARAFADTLVEASGEPLRLTATLTSTQVTLEGAGTAALEAHALTGARSGHVARAVLEPWLSARAPGPSAAHADETPVAFVTSRLQRASRPPFVDELRAFDAFIATPLLDRSEGAELAWTTRFAIEQLGLELAALEDRGARVTVLAPRPDATGPAVGWIATSASSPLVVRLGAEHDAHADVLATAVLDVMQPRDLLFSSRDAAGSVDLAGRVLELAMDRDASVVSLLPVRTAEPQDIDALLTRSRLTFDERTLSATDREVQAALVRLGMHAAWDDGSARARTLRRPSALLTYARQVPASQVVQVSIERRAVARLVAHDRGLLEERLERLGWSPIRGDVVAELARAVDRRGTCDRERAMALLARYTETQNPYTLATLRDLALDCDASIVLDAPTNGLHLVLPGPTEARALRFDLRPEPSRELVRDLDAARRAIGAHVDIVDWTAR